MHDYYEVIPPIKPVNSTVEVPGSKSITNRALLLAAMASGKSRLTNVLFSDDSEGFMECLQKLGFQIKADAKRKIVDIQGGCPAETAEINVRSAGTSARFLTAMLAANKGIYTVNASSQMQNRPMKPLLDALQLSGCTFNFSKSNGSLPYVIYGTKLKGGEIMLHTEQSSQFTGALLMTGCLYENDLLLRPVGKEISKSYNDITIKMMEQFGVICEKGADGTYSVKAGQQYTPRQYRIEPDISGACYFYAAAALTGGTMLVKNVRLSSMQGDIKFLSLLTDLGCRTTETGDGVLLTGPANGTINGIDVDMNDFSDQVMTLAAMAPFASSPINIRNIKHIKHQESDRINAVLTELSRMGIKCAETETGIIVYPGIPAPALIETYDDHRMAMAFSLIGLKARGIKISNPSCTKKTFRNYFEIFDSIIK